MSSDTTSDLSYADTLWKSADALRGQVDAAEYKHVVLGLLFLKYISDSFQSRRDELQTELTKDGISGKQLAMPKGSGTDPSISVPPAGFKRCVRRRRWPSR